MKKVLVAAVVVLGAMANPAAAKLPSCGDPGESYEQKKPEYVGMSSDKLQAALDWANQHTSTSVAVYRHKCLVGESRLDGITRDVQFDGWSMTKSVTALLVGRAVTLKLYDARKPLKPLYPEADKAHGKVLPTHLLSMTTGTHRNWIRDLSPQYDRVKDALSLPFDHKPGAHWEYQQSNVTWLLDSVERAVGSEDIQDWAQENLFHHVGIKREWWTWERDRSGNTEGWAHLKMVNQGWARIGQLMLNKGRWQGRKLVNKGWIKKMTTPSSRANEAYGYLTWLNSGGRFVLPNVEGEDTGSGKLVASGPADMYLFAGSGEQRVFVIPSYDIVIVRLGERGSREGDTRASVWTGRGGELDNELVRRVLISLYREKYKDPGPYPGSDLYIPPPDDGIAGDAFDWEHAAAGLGIGPNAPDQ